MKLTSFLQSTSPGLITWVLGWILLWFLNAYLELHNLVLVLVLTSAIAAIWLSVGVTSVVSLIALMAFNWAFVAPIGTFRIDFHQDALLLLAMLVVNIIIASLMASLREKSRLSLIHVQAVDMLRSWSDRLRDSDNPHQLLPSLQKMMEELSGSRCALLVASGQIDSSIATPALIRLGSADKEQLDGLSHCLRIGQSLGPSTGRYQDLGDLYLPLRGRKGTYGALIITPIQDRSLPYLTQAQALCDQMGIALERHCIFAQEQKTRDEAKAQSVRNTLLAAISHDYRTPLATIIGAASTLEDLSERMTSAQRKQLARSITDEADRLRRLTNNILQLARLDTVDIKIHFDWESAEEIIGSVLTRLGTHHSQQRLVTDVQPGLPLVRADPLLLSQLLENLIDNALKYSLPESLIEIKAYTHQQSLVLAVINQGPALSPEQIETFFLPFQRGDQRQAEGAGIGLTLCKTIAHVHKGDLIVRHVSNSVSFECHLPLVPQPIFNESDAPPLEQTFDSGNINSEDSSSYNVNPDRPDL